MVYSSHEHIKEVVTLKDRSLRALIANWFSRYKNKFIRWGGRTNHKIISILYVIFGFWGGLLGTSFSRIIRIHLAQPGNQFLREHIYNTVITAHALLIIFFMVMPVLIGGFGNWLLPILFGSADLVFPRANNLSFWLMVPSMFLLLASVFIEGAATRWTVYPPMSSRNYRRRYSVDFAILSLHVAGASSILASINFLSSGSSTRARSLE